MAIVSLISAKGSPGVTTLSVALGLAWPGVLPGRGALCVDADPVGGDTAAGVLRGALPATAGMLPLATTRGVDPLDAIDAASVHLRSDGLTRLVPGVPDAARAAALTLAWDVVRAAREGLDDTGTDVLVDAGRPDLGGPVPAWVTDADLALLVLRPTLPAVTAAHRLTTGWMAAGAVTAGIPLALVIVAAPSVYRPGEVADAVGVDLMAVVDHDPIAARVHSEGASPSRGFARSGYVRGVQHLADHLGERLRVPDREPAGVVRRTVPVPATSPGER